MRPLTVILTIGFLIICCKGNDKAVNSDYYTAGVVEYGNELDRDIDTKRYLESNLQSYLHFIDLAKEKNVDILVFPEATFNYLSTRELMIEHGIILPNPNEKIAPWEHNDYSEILKTISKRCKDKQIYVLVNLVEKIECNNNKNSCTNNRKKHSDGYELYNTNVVFDRQGRVISKYQKYNLFVEPLVEQPMSPQLATFTTDFNVKFGHFICFDILFKEPAISLLQQENVTNFLYPSMWFSDFPFLTSVQTHQSWAYSNNVNLISAGASFPQQGSTGSGIYAGQKEIVNVLITPRVTTKLLVGKVPKDIRSTVPPDNQRRNDNKLKTNNNNNNDITHVWERFTPMQMQSLKIIEVWSDQDVYKMEIFNETQSICIYDDICCNFKIKMKRLQVPPRKIAYKYRLVANYSKRLYGTERSCGEIYCSIVSCTTENPKSCGRRFKDNTNVFNSVEFEKIEIEAKVRYNKEEDLLVLPTTLDTSILPLDVSDYKFNTFGEAKESGLSFKKYKMESRGRLKNIITFGIFGRNFNLDGFVVPKGSRHF